LTIDYTGQSKQEKAQTQENPHNYYKLSSKLACENEVEDQTSSTFMHKNFFYWACAVDLNHTHMQNMEPFPVFNNYDHPWQGKLLINV